MRIFRESTGPQKYDFKSFGDFLLLIEANKKEKAFVEQSNKFVLGAELEFIGKNQSSMDDIADELYNYTYKTIDFDYDEDPSIKPESERDIGIEVKTFPTNWKSFQNEITVFFDFIQKYGYTNDSCGFHVTINYEDAKLPADFGQKLAASMNDPKVYKDFPSRKDSEHAISRTKEFGDYKKGDFTDKHFTFRIREDTNQVEFRSIGGKNYEYKWPTIKNLLLDYMAKYHKAVTDPSFMQRKIISNRFPQKLPTDPEAAYHYAMNVAGKRDRALEYRIMQSPRRAYEYAVNVIKGRWPEAEPYIMKDPEYAFDYAEEVIKGRWPEAESYIMKSPEQAYHYAVDIMKEKWPEAEPYIMKSPEYAYRYARNVIKGRWPQAEPYIVKDPFNAYYYAMYVMHQRWPAGEPYIMKEPFIAYLYADNVIKGRWPEAESSIMTQKAWWREYQDKMRKNHGVVF